MSNKPEWGSIFQAAAIVIVGGSIALISLAGNLFYIAEQWAGWGTFFFGD